MRRFIYSVTLSGILALAAVGLMAQAPTVVQVNPFGSPTIPGLGNMALVPISATTAVNNQTTLTIPAPAGGLYNYVCYLAFEASQDATSTAYSVAVTTSTNFNSFATKFSQAATVNIDSGVVVLLNAQAGGGCPKSASPGVATTFVSPTANAHATWTWYAAYFQAP